MSQPASFDMPKPGEGYTIRCSVCQSNGGLGEHQTRYQAAESAIGRGWILTPVVDLCPNCEVMVRAALEKTQTRYERIGQEALRLAVKHKTELFSILMDERL